MNIAVIGTGYVGLVSGVCLAAKGHRVTCVDLRAEVVASLNRGQPHIHEQGLPELLERTLAAGRFRATTILDDALIDAEIALIAVGTPSEQGRIDLQFVRSAAAQIGAFLRKLPKFISIVVKSTVVPGTTDTIVRETLEEASGMQLGEFGVGMNPEFLREGSAVFDFMNPDRIVLGHEDEETRRRLEILYGGWSCEKIEVNTRTAEMIKYANNCLLATQISAVNELANVCAVVGGIDPMEVMRGVHADRRWNPIDASGHRIAPQILTYLVPGCGFGGSCFPKDVQALRSQGEALGAAVPLLNSVLEINASQPLQIVVGLERHWGGLDGRRVLMLGLAFKPETDDLRESPSRPIAAALAARGAVVVGHDPVALPKARREWADLNIDFVDDWRSALTDVDGVVLVTPWWHYGVLASEALRSDVAGKVIFDARRRFSARDFPASAYLSIGFRPKVAEPILA